MCLGVNGFIRCTMVYTDVIALYFIMMKVMPPERDAIEGGKRID